MKTCPVCKIHKESTEFYRKENGLSGYCQLCTRIKAKESADKKRGYSIPARVQRDPSEPKECTGCKTVKSAQSFYLLQPWNRLASQCKLCMSAISRAKYASRKTV